MENNKQNNSDDISFLEENSGGIQFKDILFLVLHNLHWFILCALLGAGIAYYKVKGVEKVYSSSATIMLKTGSSGGSESLRSSAVMDEFMGRGVAVSSIFNEMMILQSQTLMERVVRLLDLNTMYSYTTRLAKRNKALYKDSPIEVHFPDANDQTSVSFVITPKDSETIVLSEFQGQNDSPQMTVHAGDTVNTPVGRVAVAYTWFYNESYNNISINMQHHPVATVASWYRYALNVVPDDERKNTILRLSINDSSPTRAADVLNTLIMVYNEDSMEDQRRILQYSTKYIEERIAYLDNDIDAISQEVVDFQQQHNIIDVRSYGQSYVASSVQYSEELKELKVQRGLAQYLLDYVESNTEHDLIPSNMGLQGKAATLIDSYDELAIQLNKYKQSGTMNNPQAQAKLSELITLEAGVKEALESYLSELDMRISLDRKSVV